VPVSHALSDDPDASPGDEQAARLVVDAALCERLRQQGFQGPGWVQFTHELLAYGLATTKALIASGVIFGEVRRYGRGVSDSRWMLSPEDIDEIASDTVLRGYQLFVERGLIKEEWSAAHGRTLAQYFRAACVREFPNALRKRERDLRKQGHVSPIGDIHALESMYTQQSTNECYRWIEKIADLLSEQQLEIFTLRHEGHSVNEVAEQLQQTPRWVTNQITRARAKITAHATRPRGTDE
jgi:RNA polymerase sigma factor (sigma-70 family)